MRGEILIMKSKMKNQQKTIFNKKIFWIGLIPILIISELVWQLFFLNIITDNPTLDIIGQGIFYVFFAPYILYHIAVGFIFILIDRATRSCSSEFFQTFFYKCGDLGELGLISRLFFAALLYASIYWIINQLKSEIKK